MKIFAVIVTYNGMQWIDRCLKSLIDSSMFVFPVVIDNNSQDGTVEYIRTTYPSVVLLPQYKNLGFGKANNVGFEYAIKNGAEYVLLLNQDAWILPDTIEKLLKHTDGKSLLSPIHLNGIGDQLDYNFRKYSILNVENDTRLIDDLILNCYSSKYEVKTVNAACWLMPIYLLHTIGGFNPLFHHYAEDNNYIQRIHYHGISIFIVSNAFMHHDRKQYGNIKTFEKNTAYRNLLLLNTDVSKFFKDRFRGNLKVFMVSFLCLCRADFIGMSQNFKALLMVLLNYKAIRQSRSIEKRIHNNWLNK